ncbi:MAG: glycosyltransferase [Methylococcaceae bacterium]
MKNNIYTDDRPLATFILMVYNQEKWVAEAVRAALSQDYCPLEIIISDDGSTDSSFEIIKNEVASYFGPHKVFLNQNNLNLGIARHLSQSVRNASGDIVVYACGDDISLPHRTSSIVDAWKKNGEKTILVHSNFQSIDEDGSFLPEHFKIDDRLYDSLNDLCDTNMFVVGSTSAYTRDLIISYPEFVPDLVHEDCCTPFRARLLDAPVISISDALILYRRVGVTSNYSTGLSRNQSRTFFKRAAADYAQKKIDAESVFRFDLIPSIEKKIVAYKYAEMCAGYQFSLFELMEAFFSLNPPLWFSFKQLIKFRMGFTRYIHA